MAAWSIKTWIDATGAEVDEASATGFRYQALDGAESQDKAKKVGEAAEVQLLAPAQVGTRNGMLAIMGGITVATNFASSNHNPKSKQYRKFKTQDNLPDDTAAVLARFERLVDGTWDTAAGEGRGVGRGIDVEALVDATLEFSRNAGAAAPDRDTLLEQFKIAEMRKTFYEHKDVRPIYTRLVEAKRVAAQPATSVNLADLLATMAGGAAPTM